MPTYDYECATCKNRFELFQNMTDEPVSTCPSCGGPVKRLITAGGGFIVKGGSARRETACGSDIPCCGQGEPCGKSHNCG